MTIEEAMAALGVTARSLSEEDRRSLDEKGFVVFDKAARPLVLADLRASFERLMKLRRPAQVEPGARTLSELVDQGPCYDAVYSHPRVLAAVHHLFQGPFRLASLEARDPIQGNGEQPLHTDWDKGEIGATALWMVDDFAEDNGAFRVVPGSHRAAPDSRAPFTLGGPAGSIAVLDGRLHRAGGLNRSPRKCRTVLAKFVRTAHPRRLTPSSETAARLSAAHRFILGC
jgi:hypothetical protein